jgi:hypothetical protein
MSQIYGKTDRALAWLGEGNQQTQAAIRILWGLSTSAWKYGINTARPLFANLLHRPDEDIKKAMRVLLLRSTATTTYEAEVIS